MEYAEYSSSTPIWNWIKQLRDGLVFYGQVLQVEKKATWSLWYDLQLPLPSTNVKVTKPEEAKDLGKTQKVTSKKNIHFYLHLNEVEISF